MDQPVIIFTEDRTFLNTVLAILEPVKGFYVHCRVESLLELEMVLNKMAGTYIILDGQAKAINHTNFLSHWQRFKNRIEGSCLVGINEATPVSQYLFMGIQALIEFKQLESELPNALSNLTNNNCFIGDRLLFNLTLEHREAIHSVKINSLLTPREIQVLQLILQEKSNSVIANELFISIHTVNSHRKNIFRKLGVKSIVGLLQLVGNNLG